MKKSNFPQKVYAYLVNAQRWYLETPERSLDEAYKAALLIKAIEDEHFNGNKIAPESANYGDSVMAYFQSELKKYLKTARTRLTEFKASRSFVRNPNQTITRLAKNDGATSETDSFAIQPRNNPTLILEKLRFIDEVTAKYNDNENLEPLPNAQIVPVDANSQAVSPKELNINTLKQKAKRKIEETNVLPRSIISTINRLQQELDPAAEQEIVKKFRSSQKRTLVSLRIILLLIIVPFLTQQITKHFIVGPLVDHLRNPTEAAIFINPEMEERALIEMQRFEEKLKFRNFLNPTAELSPAVVETEMRSKARELAEEFRDEGSNAIKNVFADLSSIGAFAGLIVISKREIAVLKDFLDNIIYGLSDSAKAFLIILFTDIFVGFHSTHGWEVILEGLSRHFGLPENRHFIFLFIATFPVILDAVFKYWIFRYLNRISPSAVATYRNMNE